MKTLIQTALNLITLFSFFISFSAVSQSINVSKTSDKLLNTSLFQTGSTNSDINPFFSGFSLEASSDNSTAKLTSSTALSTRKDNKNFYRNIAFGISAPVDKSTKESLVADLDGLTNSARIFLNYGNFVLVGARNTSATIQEQQVAFCEGLNIDIDKVNCDGEAALAKGGEAALMQFDSLFFQNPYSYFYGLNAEYGLENFKYFNLETLEKETEAEEPFSLGVYAGIHTGQRFWLKNTFISLSYKYQEAHKSAATKTICPSGSEDEPLVECTTGAIGQPVFNRQRLFSVELRKQFSSIAVAFKFTFDDVNNNRGIDLPIYLIKGPKNQLRGGIKLGWVDTAMGSDTVIGLFVRSPFTIFN